MFIDVKLSAALFTCLSALARSTPLTQDSDNSQPITWINEGQAYCWQPQDGQLTANQPLVVVACDDSPPQQFVYNTDTTAIRLANTDLCVEFSSGRGANGHPLRIQNCRSKGPPGQQLVVDGDRIRLQKGPGLYADVKDGVVVDGVGPLQSWRRVEGNNHQSFFGQPSQPLAIGNPRGLAQASLSHASGCESYGNGTSRSATIYLISPYALSPVSDPCPATLTENQAFYSGGSGVGTDIEIYMFNAGPGPYRVFLDTFNPSVCNLCDGVSRERLQWNIEQYTVGNITGYRLRNGNECLNFAGQRYVEETFYCHENDLNQVRGVLVVEQGRLER
ncbi:hypothetical protein QFC20_001949 [Naganishia adeliensis]|uniref:Uncharacterized protein n=1 Tax=Naganishia adeliensis TaxID=92952 RepID=A0ACC2WST3_9TREE|nr:hypothetical protein QFC20_001949 [Naganishia adeliensis]